MIKKVILPSYSQIHFLSLWGNQLESYSDIIHLEEYSQWYGFYYDYKNFVPGPIYSTNEEMIHYIKNIDTQFNKQQVIDFKNKFMNACDGHSTERIINLVFQKS